MAREEYLTRRRSAEGRRIWEKGSASVLGCKKKFGAFQEVVGEDDEFSHEGSESEFFWLCRSEEKEVERSEDRLWREATSAIFRDDPHEICRDSKTDPHFPCPLDWCMTYA